MKNRRLQSCFFILTALAVIAAPGTGLLASDSAADLKQLRAAIRQADQLEQSPDARLETELTTWLKVKDQPISLNQEPVQPGPGNVPEQPRDRALAFIAHQASGGATTRARSSENEIIRNRDTATEGPRASDAHVPSAYRKYLSLRYHAGPPAKANR